MTLHTRQPGTLPLRTVIILLLLIIFPSVSMAQSIHEKAGTSAAVFRKIGIGSRPVAMGEAFGGLADDASAIYWNPAGLGFIKGIQIPSMHLEWFEDIRYEFIGLVYSLDKYGTAAISFTELFIEDIEQRDINDPDVVQGYFDAKDLAYTLSYGKTVGENLSLGINITRIRQTIERERAYGTAYDIGALYKTPLDGFNVGFVIQNIGDKIEFFEVEDPLPLNYKLGLSYAAYDGRWNNTLDFNKYRDDNLKVNIGTEYWLDRSFAIRAGYKADRDLEGLTFGFGIKAEEYFEIDYAFVDYAQLDATHRFSLLVKL
jgi:uncharacterized protein UPF0164